MSSGYTGCITVAAVLSAASSFVPRALARLAGRYPGICLRLLDGSLHATVLGGQADVGIGFNDTPIAGLQAGLLGEDPYVVALPASHRWRGRRSLRLQDLRGGRCCRWPAAVATAPAGAAACAGGCHSAYRPRGRPHLGTDRHGGSRAGLRAGAAPPQAWPSWHCTAGHCGARSRC
ncbi:LysR substrate-binding domain-containing protein [Burkholderiaceae bacterium UC74_6]